MITEIEDKLNTINEDKFANVARLYLSYRFNNVLSTGFALGQEKSRRGIPDNFIPLQNEYYCFNEITTVQQKDLKAKLSKDITDCFEQKHIPKEKIAQIILICNRKVNPKLYDELINHKNDYSSATKLEIIGIDDFANQIFRDYPSLCKELGISIDTGQILEVEGFIKQYEKSKFATTLQNQFYNREKEIDDAFKFLKNGNLLLIYGQAGTGKTKLSLEIVKRFKNENPDFNLKYIINNNQLIWDDLKTQLTINKNYLLVIDDANKLRSNLDLIANFIKEEREGQIKIIFTVRDYVKNEIFDRFFNYQEIELKNFSREELSKILESKEFNITRYGIDKIFSISKGNPRLAIMAATAALNDDYDKLNNAATIFEEYFSSIKNDLESLKDKELLKVAGILAIYRNIDIGLNDVVNEIGSLFNIDSKTLIEKLQLLFQYEVADEFRGAYKISDQILGEYIFYLTFIDEQYISFKNLLDIYVEKSRFSLSKVLNPIIQNYGFKKVKDKILPALKFKWNELGDDNIKKVRFLKDFWFYLPTEGLLYVKDKIETFNQIENLNSLKLETYRDNYIEQYDDDLIDLLIRYNQLPDKLDLTLELLMKYALTSQIVFTKVLKAFKQSFSYGQYSFENKYFLQRKLFDFLYQKAEGNHIFFSRIILFIADEFLVDSYHSTSSDGRAMIIQTLPVIISVEEQKQFRKKLWDFIFNCFQSDELKENVYDFFKHHKYSPGSQNIKEVIEYDKELIIPFFTNNFLEKSFKECEIVQNYIRRLGFAKVEFEETLKRDFISDEFKLWFILNERALEKKKILTELTESYSAKDYFNFLETINIIYQNKSEFFSGYSTILDSITEILIHLANSDFELFLKVFKKMYDYDYASSILTGKLFSELVYDKEKVEKLKAFIYHTNTIEGNKITLIRKLPKEYISIQDYKIYKELINRREINNFWFIDDIFRRISDLGINIKIELNDFISMLYSKTQTDENTYIHQDFFTYLFDEHNDIYIQNLRIIEKIYMFLENKDSHFDYELSVLKQIVSVNPKFIIELLESHFDKSTHISKRELEYYGLHKLWEIENADTVIVCALEFFKKVPMFWCNASCEASYLFNGNSEKERNLLLSLIGSTSDSKELRMLFNIVVSKYGSEKYEFLKLILNKNKNLELFRKLDFYVQSSTFSGSRIPRIQKEISEFEELKDFLEKLNDLDLLNHIVWVENSISSHKREIEEERKREFLDEWGY